MKNISFCKNGIGVSIDTDDAKTVSLSEVGGIRNAGGFNRFFVPVEVHITGTNPDDHHGGKHTGGAENSLKYAWHKIKDDSLEIGLENEMISVALRYDFIPDTKVIRSRCEVKNISDSEVGLEYVSIFCMYGFSANKVRLCHNSWCRELQWQDYTLRELGYSRINGFSTKRIAVSNTGTWSTKEYMPMGMVEGDNGTIFWQIENNGSWNFEISDIQNVNYLKLAGPSEQENGWWRSLKPGESYETPYAAVAFSDCFDGAIAEMTKYRNKIAYQSVGDEGLPVIFNDYMMCLKADPTTEKEIPVIDAAAEAGAEVYCMDAGWYADGVWWDTVGEWKVCERRFPDGLKAVFDYIRSKGMRPGIWLEPEVMGINCPVANELSDECFFMRHGKRVIDHGRYQLDFRCKQVRDRLDKVVDGLVRDFGIEYFKFDYNIDGGLGTETASDSFGDGLMRHQSAYLEWIDGIYKRYPWLIIENCGSGGMRMDYRTLSHFSLQSVSDAENYTDTAVIAAMSGTAVVPGQAQIWALPMVSHTDGEIAFNMVNTMFRRPVISGETHLLSERQKAIIKEGVEFYKATRDIIPKLIPFYPKGTVGFYDSEVVYGFKSDKNAYLCIGRLDKDRNGVTAAIDIPIGEYTKAECVYPVKSADFAENCITSMDLSSKTLSVVLPENSAVIIKLM